MVTFSAEAYFGFLQYFNTTFWPLQIFTLLLGLVFIISIVTWPEKGGRLRAGILAIAWGLNGALYHLVHFSKLNFWDYGIGSLCLIQAALLAWTAISGRWFKVPEKRPFTAVALMTFVVFGYPLLTLINFSRPLSQAAIFGLAPGPTILFTIAALMLYPLKGYRMLWPIVLLNGVAALALAWAVPIIDDVIVLTAITVILAARIIQQLLPQR